MKRIFTSFLFLTLCVLMGFAQSLKLNGVDQYMSIPNDAAFFPATGGGYTVTFKVKLADYLQNNARFVGARTYTGATSNSTTTGYEIWGGKSATEFMAANFSLEGSPWGHGCAWAQSTAALNEFVHVAFVVRPANKETALYINGKQSKTQSDKDNAKNLTNTPWGNHGKDILVGAGWQEVKSGDAISGESVVGFFANCEMDDVHFYDKALNSKGLKADMNNFTVTADGLVAAYDFENVEGNTVPDVSGKGHDAQLHGYQAPAPVDCSVSYDSEIAEGFMYVNKIVDGLEELVMSYDMVPSGTELVLVAEAYDTKKYEIDYFTANDQPIEGNRFILETDTHFSAVFKTKSGEVPVQQYTVTYTNTKPEGRMGVYCNSMMVFSGDKVDLGAELLLEAWPFENYALDYFTANGEKIEGNTYTVNGDVAIDVIFKQLGVDPQPQPEEPTYAVPAPEANRRGTPSARLVKRITVTGATVDGQEAPFTSVVNSGNAQSEVYKDMTAETLAVTAGDLLHFDIQHQIEWMHFYVYIDYNHDGIFDVDNELVAYSYLNGQDSEGNAVEGSTLRLPDFTVKADAQAVKTRMRIKVDWDSNDPTGNKDPNNTIGKNNGAIYDYTIDIHAYNGILPPPVSKHTVTFAATPATSGIVKVNTNNQEPVASGSQVKEGTELELIILVNEGNTLGSVTVNGTEKKDLCDDHWSDGSTYTLQLGAITEDTDIQVRFDKKQLCKVTYSSNVVGGEIILEDEYNNPLQNGAELEAGATPLLKVNTYPDYELASITVNDEKFTTGWTSPFGPGRYFFRLQPITGNTTIVVEFKSTIVNHKLTYTYNDEGGEVLVMIDDDIVASDSEFADGVDVFCVIAPKEGYELNSVVVNDVESKDQCEWNAWDESWTLSLFAADSDLNIAVTFSAETGIGEVALTDAVYNAEAQSLYVPAGAHATVYNAAGQPVMGVSGEATLSAAQLPAGTYVIRIASASAVKVMKIIKK